MSRISRVELRRLLLFVLVGTLNTAVCYALYALLVEFCAWHYDLALAADYGFGTVLGYVLHRASTFADRLHVERAFGKYTLTLVVTFLANFAVLDGLVRWELLGPLSAQGVAMAVVTLGSYWAQHYWVFRSNDVGTLDAAPAVSLVSGDGRSGDEGAGSERRKAA